MSYIVKSHTDLYLSAWEFVAGRPVARQWHEVQGMAHRFPDRNQALYVVLGIDEEKDGICARIVKLVSSPPIGGAK